MSLVTSSILKRDSRIIFDLFKSVKKTSVSSCKHNKHLLNFTCSQFALVQHQDVRFAGHSKWQNIRHTKAAKDGDKSKLFGKISIALTKAALKGSDPKFNKELSNLLDLCRKENVSRDLIDRALKRAATEKLVNNEKAFIGPNDVNVVVNFLYDPRTTKPSQFLKSIFKNFKEYKFVDAKMVINNFCKKGIIFISKYDQHSNPIPFEKIEEIAIESEAEEIEITCEEDKLVPPLPEENDADAKSSKSKKKDAYEIEPEDDSIDLDMHWKLIFSDEDLLTAKGTIEKSYPDLIIKSYSIDYTAKDKVSLDKKEMDTFNKFCEDLSEVEELERIFSNVN